MLLLNNLSVFKRTKLAAEVCLTGLCGDFFCNRDLNMKKIFIGTLLGIALCLGGGQTVLAEGDIVEEVTANEDFATDETDEWEATDDPEGSFQGDASFGTVENDGNSTENADVLPQEAEDGFYSGTEELAFFFVRRF